MSIEWGTFSLPATSNMTLAVYDNDGLDPGILKESLPFTVKVDWDVPGDIATILGGKFRLRIMAESIGPGPETQIVSDQFVPVGASLPRTYSKVITVPPFALPGEGNGTWNEGLGPVASGVYQLIAVLQHLNGSPDTATQVSGFADGRRIMIRRP
jgi:hypothetical protein